MFSSKKKVTPLKKDTLWQLLEKLWVSVLVLSAMKLDPMLWDFLVLRLVLEVFREAGTLYMPAGIDIQKLVLDILQQQSLVLGWVKLN